MPYRRLPNSDRSRLSALMQAEDKLAHMTDEPNPLSHLAVDQLGELLPKWQQAVTRRDDLRARRNAIATRTREVEDSLRQKISHYIQVMNLAIRRGDAPIGMRAICGLDLNQTRLPALSSQQQVNVWAHQITRHLDSEFKGTIQSPSAQDIADELTTFEFALIELKRAKAAYDDAMEAAQILRPEVDELIRDIWDEIDFYYRKQPKSSIRRKARAFGVVYVSESQSLPPEAPESPEAPEAPEAVEAPEISLLETPEVAPPQPALEVLEEDVIEDLEPQKDCNIAASSALDDAEIEKETTSDNRDPYVVIKQSQPPPCITIQQRTISSSLELPFLRHPGAGRDPCSGAARNRLMHEKTKNLNFESTIEDPDSNQHLAPTPSPLVMHGSRPAPG